MRRRRLLMTGGSAIGLAAIAASLEGCVTQQTQPTHPNRLWLYATSLGQRSTLPSPGLGVPLTFSGSLDRAYESRWYKVEGLRPGDDVAVTLHMPAGTDVDYTLLGYTDLRKIGQRIVDQIRATGNLDADDMDSDDMDSDDMDSDDMDSDDMDSDDMDSDDMDSDDMDSDDMDSDDMDSDDMDSGDRDTFRYVYSRAQRHGLRAASITPGPADEQVHLIARGDGGDLYFRVRGHLGAYAPGKQFTIEVNVKPDTSCDGVPLQPVWSDPPANLLGGKDTLIVINTYGTFGTLEWSDVKKRSSLNIDDPNTAQNFQLRIAELKRVVNGQSYDLASNDKLKKLFDLWRAHADCVPLANTVVESIRQLIASTDPKRTLKYIVLIGADDVIPFARIEDRAEISREWSWPGPYDAKQPLGATLTWGTYLSDDPYGRHGPLDARGKGVRAPDVAVGRLVESADDINAHIDWYVTAGLRPTVVKDALVAGYGFVSDLASDVAGTFASAGASADNELNSDTNRNANARLWNLDDLKAKLARRKYQLFALMGHYNAWTLRPADPDSDRLFPSDVAVRDLDLTGALWMTIGCHSGHNVVDREARDRLDTKRDRSWPETLLPKGATMVVGTGYQYGESVLLENSEKLYSLLAQQIASANAVGIGDALIVAKRQFLEGRFQGRQMKGMDQKIVEVATLYGLPMWKVGVEMQRTLPPPPVKPKSDKSVAIEGVLQVPIKLEGYTLTVASAPPLSGTYFSTGEAPIARPLHPVLPGLYRDIALPGGYPVGILWTSGSFTDVPNTPLISEPVREDPLPPARRPKYRNRAFLPVRPFRISRSGAKPAATARGYTFVFAPLQIATAQSGTMARQWNDASFTLCYTSTTDATAALDAPHILAPERVEDLVSFDGTHFNVKIEVRHFAKLDEPVQAYASYVDTRAGKLATVKLTGGASTQVAGGIPTWTREFTGTLNDPANPNPDRDNTGVFFQAMGGNGRVSALTNGGQLFKPTMKPTRATKLTLVGPSFATYRQRIKTIATLVDDNGNPVSGADVLFRIGASRLWLKTDASGRALATLTVATRPRASTYLLLATFPGRDVLHGSAASIGLKVDKAKVTLSPTIKLPGALPSAPGRRPIARLKLSGSDALLGDRPILVTRAGPRTLYVTFTEADGSLRLGAADVNLPFGEADVVTMKFEGDDRYEEASSFDIAFS